MRRCMLSSSECCFSISNALSACSAGEMPWKSVTLMNPDTSEAACGDVGPREADVSTSSVELLLSRESTSSSSSRSGTLPFFVAFCSCTMRRVRSTVTFINACLAASSSSLSAVFSSATASAVDLAVLRHMSGRALRRADGSVSSTLWVGILSGGKVLCAFSSASRGILARGISNFGTLDPAHGTTSEDEDVPVPHPDDREAPDRPRVGIEDT
mmetsp:Transcript_54663/g.145988  ORF Transcript_54663/g.145988 Transcript_54663/m.145988 type:complete len:213 (+) Transcript_54663:402-1040(+)